MDFKQTAHNNGVSGLLIVMHCDATAYIRESVEVYTSLMWTCRRMLQTNRKNEAVFASSEALFAARRRCRSDIAERYTSMVFQLVDRHVTKKTHTYKRH